MSNPSPFKGPRQPRYTVAQFAAAYEVPPERVQAWLLRGFLQADKRGSIPESARLRMIRYYGEPATKGSTLP